MLMGKGKETKNHTSILAKLMNHIVVILFKGIHNIAVHNVRQGQGVHKFFDKGRGICIMIYFIQNCNYPFQNIYGPLFLDVHYVQQCYEFP